MNNAKCYQLADILTECFSCHQAVTTEVLRQTLADFIYTVQEPAEKLTDKCHEMHCIYSRKHHFTPYRHADLTWHDTHQFHKEIWALAFEHPVVLLIQHNHNVSCLVARLLQAWELSGAVMVAGLTCGFKIWSKSTRPGHEFKTQHQVKRLPTETTNGSYWHTLLPSLVVVLPIAVVNVQSSKFGQNPGVNH